MYRAPAFSCHNIISISLLDLYYSGAINRLKSSLRGAYQCEPVLALRLRLWLARGVGGAVLVATPGSVHSTFIELQLLIRPQHHSHIRS